MTSDMQKLFSEISDEYAGRCLSFFWALEQAYRAGLEIAMVEQCQGCRSGWKFTPGGHLDPAGGYSQCKSESIRNLINHIDNEQDT